MVRCKGCDAEDWEEITSFKIVEEGQFNLTSGETISLWQCRSCKRVVDSGNDTDINNFDVSWKL